MTETSYYPPTASPSAFAGSDTPGPVQVAIAGPARQRRATVAVRAILAIPHLIALDVLGIAAFVVMVIGWFGALATGRLPTFAHGYLSGYLRWASRVSAYLLLLTDEYPPFAFDDDAYPVRVAVGPGRLNRLAVLFRFILSIPAAIMTALLGFGTMILVILAGWPALLITGKLPASLHQALAAVLRYTIRANYYMYLLTDTYPAGLFGDPPGSQPTAEPPFGGSGYAAPAGPGYGAPGDPSYGAPAGPSFGAPAGGFGTPEGPRYGAPRGSGYGASPAAYGTPGYGAPGYGSAYGQSGYGAPQAGYGTQAGYGGSGYQTPAGYGTSNYTSPGYGPSPIPGYPAPAAGAYGQDVPWQLVLSAGARRLVRVILAFGLLLMAGEGFGVGVVVNAAIVRDREINQLNTEIAQHNAAVARLNAEITREQEASGQVHNAITAVSGAYHTLNSAINNSVSQANACATITCFDAAAVPAANGLTAFGRALHAVSIPAGSSAIANRLVADSNSTAQGWTNMSHAASFTDYENDATSAESTGGKFDNDYAALQKSLDQVESTLQNQAASLDSQALTLNNGDAALIRRGAQLNVSVKVESASEA
jgi:hypothetical protein